MQSALALAVTLVLAAVPVEPAERAVQAPLEVPARVPLLGQSPASTGRSSVEDHGVGSSYGSSDPAERRESQARLRGKVYAIGSRDALAGARVVAVDGPQTTTDAEGSFELWLAPGRREVVLRADGFKDLHVKVSLRAGDDHEYEYRLDSDIDGNPYRTVVRQEREVAISKTTLSGDEIHAVPGARGDPFRVIQSLPGASQVAGFLPYVVVRGAAPGNTGYYLDGVRVPIIFHVALGPSVIHPYFIDSVDFYPSGAPVRLGRYTSGMIEGRTKAARRDRMRGDFDVRITDAGGILEVPFDRRVKPGCIHSKFKTRRRKCELGKARGSLTIAGRYSYTAGVLSLVQSVAKIAFWDYQARFDHRLGARANYTAFVFGSYDEIGEKEAPDPFLRFEFHRVVQKIRHRLRDGGSTDYTLALGLDRSGFGATRTNEWIVAPRVDIRLPLRRSKNAVVGFGLDQEFQIFRGSPDINSSTNANDLTAQLFNDRNVSATGFYAEVLWKQGKLEVRPGVRADVYIQQGASPILPEASSVTHAWGIDPRILIRERLSENWTLRQNIGAYHQPPSSPFPIPGFESFGFERGLQRNIQGSVGYEWTLGGLLVLTQDLYLGRLSNLQDYDLAAALTGEVLEVEDLVTQVNGWSYGLETMLRLTPKKRLFGWAAYTLSRSTRDFRIGGSAPSNWDQRHILNVVLGYRLGRKWSFGGRVHVNSGRPYTTANGGQSFADALAQNRNNSRLTPFFQLDLRIERRWQFRTWMLQAMLDVINSTYASEVLACLPPEDSATTVMVLGVAGCNAQALRYILPSIGLRGVF
ncbi:MAG TPA: TonB-dependent receptor [Nannocystis exedens]|nr:TonB-dependent receptor [Nannocystis exedens]